MPEPAPAQRRRPWWRRKRWIALILLLLFSVGYKYVKHVIETDGSGVLERRWQEAGLPGEIHVGAVIWQSFDTIVLANVTVGQSSTLFERPKEPLATVERIVVQLDMQALYPTAITVAGARLRLDAGSYQYLNDILDKQASFKPTGPPRKMLVHATGEVVIASGAVVSSVEANIEAMGPLISGPVVGRIGSDPFRLDIASTRTASGARQYTYTVTQATCPTDTLLDAVACLEIAGNLGPEVRRWFPKVITANGTSVMNDPVAGTYEGPLRVAWPGGTLTGDLRMDRRRIAVSGLTLADARLGDIEDGGRLLFERRSELLTIDARIRKPGPGLPIPPEIPRDEAAKLLPILAARIPTRAADAQPIDLRLTGAGASDAALLLRWMPGGGDFRVEGSGIPLIHAQGFMPEGLALTGGKATALAIRLSHDQLQNVDIQAAQAKLTWLGWSLGPTDGHFVLTPDNSRAHWIAMRIDLLPPGTPKDRRAEVATFTWEGFPVHPLIGLSTGTIEGVFTRLHGPVNLPDLRGSIDTRIQLDRDGDAWNGTIQQLQADRASLGDGIRNARIDLRGGMLRFGQGRFSLRCSGQLQTGDLFLPRPDPKADPWLPAAARTPIFSLDLAVEPPTVPGQPRTIRINEFLARTAAPKGEPEPGWTAQLTGTLDSERLAGRLTGAVDQVELPWLADLAGLGDLRCTGAGAASLTVDVDGCLPTAIAGAFLPLGAQITAGPLDVTGVIGEIRFRFAKEQLRP